MSVGLKNEEVCLNSVTATINIVNGQDMTDLSDG